MKKNRGKGSGFWGLMSNYSLFFEVLSSSSAQGRLAVVDMRDDREVADVREVGHGPEHRERRGAAQAGRPGIERSAPLPISKGFKPQRHRDTEKKKRNPLCLCVSVVHLTLWRRALWPQ